MSKGNGVVCVLGGAGFIGAALTKQLLKSGREVIVVGRRDAPSLPSNVRYHRIDIENRVELQAVFREVSEVVDLAYGTVPKTSFDDPVADILVNLPSTVAMMEALAACTLEKFVYVSSGGTVYGQPEYFPIREAHPTRPISPYGVTKLASERYADLYRICREVPSIIARPANAYGELQCGNSGQGFVAAAIWQTLRRLPIAVYGTRGTVRDYVHVDDVAAALVAVLDAGQVGEVYNVGTGVGADNMQIIEFLSGFAEASSIPAPKIEFRQSRPFDVASNVLDSSKLYEISGWKPQIVMSEGIDRCWNHALKCFSKP